MQSSGAAMSLQRAPLNDEILLAIAGLVDDAGATREPSHSEIQFQFERCSLLDGDPNRQNPQSPVGKAKRVRAVLTWALEERRDAGEILVVRLLDLVRSKGGFRPTSPNFVGEEAIRSAAEAFKREAHRLGEDGHLAPIVLDALSGKDLTEALRAYVRRVQAGVSDAALVVGTGKDLLEATCGHVLQALYGSYPTTANFPALLGQTFIALGWATSEDEEEPEEPVQRRVERAMFDLACANNRLRNKEGTGHGRPWLPTVTDSEARAATEFMGVLAGRLLDALAERSA